MMLSRKKYALCLTLLGSFVFSNIAHAKAPAVIEFFGKNDCATDTTVQESLLKILQAQEDVILINCRTRSKKKDAVNIFTHQFCTDRYNMYRKKFGKYRFKSSSVLIVNGRWDANYSNIQPAVSLARADNAQHISVVIKDDVVNISLPEIKSDVGHGDIFIYAYAPTRGEKAVFVDSDVELTDDMKQKINERKSVPFVSEINISPFYLRPVLARQKIGRWVGEKMDINFPLNALTSMAGSSYVDLSYAVILHEGDEYGGVLAAGESISLKEYNNTLPHSKPADIKLMSPDLQP